MDGDARRPERNAMRLGAFSISLSVRDLAVSHAFYEKLGFEVIGGDVSMDYLVLQNGISTIGIFQGMFEGNILTFNPGWGQHKETLASFEDVRDIQRMLEKRGIELAARADESGTGPASVMFLDPDGNPILIDQHVARPGS